MTQMGRCMVTKDSSAGWLVGAIDELHLIIGKCIRMLELVEELPTSMDCKVLKMLCGFQCMCLDLGSIVHTGDFTNVPPYFEGAVGNIEKWIDALSDKSVVPKLTQFIVMRSMDSCCLELHAARIKCREVERRWVGHHHTSGTKPNDEAAGIAAYDRIAATINRLSDLFFALARYQQVVVVCEDETTRGDAVAAFESECGGVLAGM